MVFRGFIASPEREPGLVERLSQALSQGVTGATKSYAEALSEQQREREKANIKLHKFGVNYVKQMHPGHIHPDRYRSLISGAEKYIAKGFLEDEAIDLAAKDLENQKKEEFPFKKNSYEELSEMSDPESKFTDIASGLGVGLLSNLEKFSKDYGLRKSFREHFPEEFKKAGYSPELSEQIIEKMKEGKSKKEQELIDKRVGSGQFLSMAIDPEAMAVGIGTGALFNLGKKVFSPLWKSAKSVGKDLGIGTQKAAENILKQAEKEGISVEKAIAGDATEIEKLNSLAGRVSQETTIPATQMRMSRLSPESKLYKRGEQEKIYHEQLKSHPKYAAEIALDAEARNARLNKPVGARALGTRSLRMAKAQMELPKAVEGYRKAAARVRALEDEIAKMPGETNERIVALLNAAKTELRDAESFAQNMLSNTKTGESWKVGFADMREAAQKKMLEIQNMIADGKEIKLALSDYNPKYVSEGKKLAKKKAVPSSISEDFYTKVHDEYRNVYRNRIESLNNEIAKPVTSLSEAQQKARYIKERDTLQKMINSGEGENAVHRRKLGLREMEQRKLAQDRLKSSIKPTVAPHIESAARPKISEMQHVQERMKTSDGRTKLAEEIVEDASKENPNSGKKIKSEQKELKEALDEVARAEEKAKQTAKEPVNNSNEAKTKTNKLMRDINEFSNALKRKDLSVFKTRIGKDLMISVGIESAKEVFKELDADYPGNAVITAFVGSPRGAGYRALFGYTFRKISDKYKKEKYKSALEKHKTEDILKMKERYNKRIIKKAEKEFTSSF